MKKIALLHYAYPPNIGGVEIMLREQAIILSKLGFDILILTGSGQESHPEVKLRQIAELQSVLNFNPGLQKKILKKGIIDEEFFSLASKIEQKLKTNLASCQSIVVHNMLTVVRNLPFIYAFRQYIKKHPEKKILIWTHDHSYIGEEKIKDIQRAANSDLEKSLLTTPVKNATYVAISATFKKLLVKLLKLPEREVHIIPDGLNVKRFLEIDDTIWAIAEKYNLLNVFPLILSPVNILERKNLEYCLDIIFHLKKYYPQVCYMISGRPSRHRKTGQYLKFLKGKVVDLGLRPNVIFLGEFINRALVTQEIHDLYSLSDLVFYFSKSENFGLPVIESILAKTPIFVSNLDVFQEIGGQSLFSFNWRKKEPAEMAQVIKKYIERNKVIKLNSKVRQEYNLATIVKEKLVPLL